ncbi:MAG TPA: Na/Pi cotransporter family protein [Dongiaceae bacterium]|jgi:phosphate:Na+ symporter|nr:Na/Pi cotransporter family protein [Dongiaceae bacterium]
MTGLIILDLMGGVALLLWGLHMVQSGVLRAFGADLRQFLSKALSNRFRAFGFGLGVTAMLQSSTATALMTSTFAASGLLALTPALAIMLGANVGTTLIVQVLSFNVDAAAPVLLVIGVLAFKRGQRTRVRDLGRVAIGLGLMLLSLHILLDTLAPAEEAPFIRTLLGQITAEPVLNVVLGAVFAWAAHSSVAALILTMSLSYAHFVTPVAALALVLGANLGSAINPVLETNRADRAAQRLPIGNLVNRLVGCAIVLPFLQPISNLLSGLDPDRARQAADFHTLFNLATALLFILPLRSYAALLTRLLPERKEPVDQGAPLYLDTTVLGTPTLALTCAAREVLHMGDIVESMLRKTMTAFLGNDRKLVAEIEQMDDWVDKLHEAVKRYVTAITRESLDDQSARRAMEIIAFSINLEHIGDIIDKNLMELASKKIKHHLKFSAEGAAELESFHHGVMDNLKLALGVFMSGDSKIARQLLKEKVQIREAERSAAESHLARLRAGRPETLETSSLHLDVLRDLKRIHSHICSVAYPVLEATGELQPSRLTQQENVPYQTSQGGRSAVP